MLALHCSEYEEDFLKIHDLSVTDFDVLLSQQLDFRFYALARGSSSEATNGPVRSHYSVAGDSRGVGILAASVTDGSVCFGVEFPSDLTVSRNSTFGNPLHELPDSFVEVHLLGHLIVCCPFLSWQEILNKRGGGIQKTRAGKRVADSMAGLESEPVCMHECVGANEDPD